MADCQQFVSCESVSLSGDLRGIFSINLAVYSIDEDLQGAGEVDIYINDNHYNGFVMSHQVNLLENQPPGVDCKYYLHNLQIQATS